MPQYYSRIRSFPTNTPSHHWIPLQCIPPEFGSHRSLLHRPLFASATHCTAYNSYLMECGSFECHTDSVSIWLYFLHFIFSLWLCDWSCFDFSYSSIRSQWACCHFVRRSLIACCFFLNLHSTQGFWTMLSLYYTFKRLRLSTKRCSLHGNCIYSRLTKASYCNSLFTWVCCWKSMSCFANQFAYPFPSPFPFRHYPLLCSCPKLMLRALSKSICFDDTCSYPLFSP